MIRKIFCWLGFHDYETQLSSDCKPLDVYNPPYRYVFFPVKLKRTTICKCYGKIKKVEKSIIW